MYACIHTCMQAYMHEYTNIDVYIHTLLQISPSTFPDFRPTDKKTTDKKTNLGVFEGALPARELPACQKLHEGPKM